MKATLPGLLLDPTRFSDDTIILREKRQNQYQPVTWGELRQQVDSYARSLIALGLEPGERVAIMANNSPRWVYADLGTMKAGGLSVPIYHTEGIDTLLYILQDSGSRFLFLQAPLIAAELLNRLDEVPQLETIVLMEEETAGGRAIGLPQLLAAGQSTETSQVEQRMAAINPDDVASLVYTSGTTGEPKGVMLSHDNFLSNLQGALEFFDITSSDECLSFLPLSHVFERTCGYYLMLHQGATIAYAESIDRVPMNLGEVQPTIAISVPRLYEKMYARVQEQVLAGSALKQWIFNNALKIGRAFTQVLLSGGKASLQLKIGLTIARALVFKKLHQRLGGRLRFFVSGGAPLGKHLAEFFLAAGIPIYEGYGLTETAPVISANSPGSLKLGSIGRLFPRVKVKIADDGEILTQGPGIFKGYWGKPEETEQVMQDGWLLTGDIGQMDDEGYLFITDRKKDLIVTAGGKNVPPQDIENQLKTDRFIANLMVAGDRKPFLVALIVPDFGALAQYAKHKKIDFLNECDLIQHPRVLDLIRRRIDLLQEDEAPYMQIKRFTLLSRDFSQADGELTPTMKVRRKQVLASFSPQVEGMYRAKDHAVHDYGFCIVDRKDA